MVRLQIPVSNLMMHRHSSCAKTKAASADHTDGQDFLRLFTPKKVTQDAQQNRYPLPETTQAPPASSEPASPAPPTFHPRDWVPLRDAVLQVISLAGEDVCSASRSSIGICERAAGIGAGGARRHDDAVLEDGLGAPDRPRSHNPAEGVGVAPYEPGRYFVSRAGLAKLTSPATPATPADRRRHAEGGSEPAARAEEPIAEPAPDHRRRRKRTRQAASAPRQGRPSPDAVAPKRSANWTRIPIVFPAH